MEKAINEKRYVDNPNPKAKIGFVIFYPFQYYVYKNIYKYLDDSEFIVDLGAFFPIEQPDGLLDDLISLLKKKGVRYRILYHSDYYFRGYLKSFFSKYTTLVSVWERGCLGLSCNLEKKKVNLTYGAGKELTQVRFSRRYHDLILAYGKRDSKLFSMYTEARIVGNPKFDDWFNNDLDQSLLLGLKEKLSNGKKTVLYLPTHGDLCSIDKIAEEIKEISKEYNIIVKMHYFVIREEPEKMKKLENDEVIIYEDDVDLLPLLKVADVVISDNSSAVFDAILADKPLVVTDFLSDEYLDNNHKKLRLSARGLIGAMTYSGSIEQVIKKEKLVLAIQKPSELKDAIENAFTDKTYYKESRKKIREDLFAFNDGKCGQRAAEEIRKIDSRDKPKNRPIMYHAVEAFICEVPELKRISHSQRILDQKRIRRYESIILDQSIPSKANKIIFSVLAIDNSGEFIKFCLRSLFWQEFPRENYEIILVSQRDEETVSRILKEIDPEDSQQVPRFKFIQPEKGMTIGHGIKKALEAAEGDYICFTQSEYTVPLKWLLDIHLAYQKFPAVAGVGGYEKTLEKNYTLFDEFYMQEIGKMLGFWKEADYQLHFFETINDLFYNNPAGTLAGVSYKKDILEKHKDIFEDQILELAGLELKKKIMEDHEICFSPFWVTNWDKMTLKKFNQKNFRYGFVYRNLCHRYPEMKKYYKYSILSPFKFMLMNILDGNSYRKGTISSIVFLAFFFRWLGGLSWQILNFFSRLQKISKRL